MNASRTPLEARPPRMELLARLPVFYTLEGKRAVVAGGSAAAAWKAELLSAAGAHASTSYATTPGEEMLAAVAGPAARRGRCAYAPLVAGRRSKRCALAIGAFDDDEEARRIRGGRARCRRAGQCHRQAGVLRFFFRLDRQSFTAGDRHFDRWCGAGFRAGDPRQARGVSAARVCRLGRRRGALAPAVKASGLPFAGRRNSGSSSPRTRSPTQTANPVRRDFERFIAEVKGLGRSGREWLGDTGRGRARAIPSC